MSPLLFGRRNMSEQPHVDTLNHDPAYTPEIINGVEMEVRSITSVQDLGNLVTSWHYKSINDLGHLINMPDDAALEIPTGTVDADGNPEFKEVTAEQREGFIAGLHVALDLMNTFPIVGRPVEDESTTAAE